MVNDISILVVISVDMEPIILSLDFKVIFLIEQLMGGLDMENGREFLYDLFRNRSENQLLFDSIKLFAPPLTLAVNSSRVCS